MSYSNSEASVETGGDASASASAVVVTTVTDDYIKMPLTTGVDVSTIKTLIAVLDELLTNANVNDKGLHSKKLAKVLKEPVKKLNENKVFVECNPELIECLNVIIKHKFNQSGRLMCTHCVKYSIFFITKICATNQLQREHNKELKKEVK